MAKKIPSASINITSALRSILTQSDVKRSVVDQNRLINSKIRVTGGAFAAAGNILSPIDHVAISYAGSTFRVTAADLISAVTDNIKVTMNYGIKPSDFVSNISDRITTFSIGKGVKDFAPATESIRIAMGYARAFTDVQSAPLDRRFIGSSKVLSTITDPIDSTSKGFVKSTKDFVNNISDVVRAQLTKSLKDFVIPLDYMTIFDGSTFEGVKVVKDVQPAIDNLARTVSYNRAYEDAQPVADRPVKGLFKSFADFVTTEDVLDFNRLREQNADDTFNISDANIKGIIKAVSDTAIPLDYMTIVDGSTFDGVKILKDTITVDDLRSTDYTKSRTDIISQEFDGPSYGDINDYSPSYFLDNYTEEFRPIWNLSKVLSDSVIPVDYMTIVDGSTFDGVKILRDTQDVFDVFNRTISFIRRNDDTVSTSDDGNTYSIIKAFKDTAVALDYMTIVDGSTFDGVKVLADTAPPSDVFTRVLSFNRQFVEILLADSFSAFTFTPGTKREIIDVSKDGSGHDTYAIDYFLDGGDPYFYVNKWLPIFNFEKVVKDSVIPLDYMTIFDGSTFDGVKVLRETLVASDRSPLDITKPFVEIVDKFEGPGFGSEDDFSLGYFLDDYTTSPRPIWTIYKPFVEPLNLIEVFTLSYTPVRTFVETMTVSDFGGDVFDLHKPFADTVGTLDETTITDGGEFRLFKTFVETLRVIEGPATRSLEDYINLDVDDGDYWTDPTYIEDHIPIYTIVKPLSDFVIPLDYMTIADGSTFDGVKPIFDTVSVSEAGQNTFDLVKPHTEAQQFFEGPGFGDINDYSPEYFLDKYTEEFRPIWTIEKVLKDSVIPLDYLTIADGSTFDYINVLPALFVDVFDNDVFNFNKSKSELLLASDVLLPFTLQKAIGDSVRPKEGPTTYDGDDYVPEWTDPAYLDDGRPIYNIIKVLPGDFAVALDYMTIADGSTFDYINVLPPDFVSNISDDGNTFNFNKGSADLQPATDVLQPFTTNLVKKEFVDQTQGPVYKDYTEYSPDYFLDNYTEYFNISYTFIKVLPTDFAIALDYMTIADGSTFDYINVLPPDFVSDISDNGNVFNFNKVLASFQYREIEGPGFGNVNDFSPDYFLDDYTEALRPIWTLTKVLADSVIPLDYLTIADGSTFDGVKVLATLQSAPLDNDTFDFNKARSSFATTSDNGNVFEFTKVLADFQLTRQGPVDYNFDGYVPGFGDPTYLDDGNILYTFSKVLSDSVVPLDYLTIADGSTFDYINVLPPDFVSDISDDGNTFSFDKVRADNVSLEDYGTLYNINLVKRDAVDQPQGPAYYDKSGYAPDFFADNYTEFFGPTYSFTKVLASTAIALDYMTIADGSTFDYINVLPPDFVTDTSDFTTTHPTKALTSSNTGTSDLLLPFTFIKGLADEVFAIQQIRIQQPLRPDRDNPQTVSQIDDDIFNLNKVLASSVIPLDYMTIADGSTFDGVKILRSVTGTPFDGSGRDNYAYDYFDDPYFYTFRLIPIFEFNKVLADSVIPLDYLTIADGSTFDGVKVLATLQPVPSDRISNISAGKVLGSVQPGVEDNGNVFNFNKVLADFQLTRQGPGENSASDYAYNGVGDYGTPVWMDPSYIDDSRAIFTLTKVLSDSVIPLDYLTIADGSTFDGVKVLSNSVSVSDFGGDVFDLTKRQAEIEHFFEGPRRGTISDFSPDYFLDDYTEDLRPIWNLSKVLADSVIPLDYMTVVDGSTFDYTNVLPPEFVTANSFSSFDWTKTKSETMVASDVFFPLILNLAKREFVDQPQGPVYYDYTQYSGDYFADNYAEYFNLKYSFTKVLSDTAIALDYMTIVDGSTFDGVKILATLQPTPSDAIANHPQKVLSSSNTSASDTLLPFTFIKGINDFVSTIDDLSIAQPYLLDRTNPQIVEQLDNDTFNLNKGLRELLPQAETTIYSYSKILSDSIRAKEGPGDNSADDYVNTWTDPSYIDDGRPVYNYIKVLPADFVTALDYMTIADGSTFDYGNVLPPEFVSALDDGNTFAFNKGLSSSVTNEDYGTLYSINLAKKEFVDQPQGPAYRDYTWYAGDYFADNYAEYLNLAYNFIKVLPTDFAIALDYMTIADGSTFDYVNVLPPDFVSNISDDGNTFNFNKAPSDYQDRELDGPAYRDYTWYAVDYLADDYTEYRNAIITFIKRLSDSVIPLDYLTIADGSTFDGVKVLSDTASPLDNKALYPIKALNSSANSLDTLLPFTFNKVLADFQLTNQGPAPFDTDDYVPTYTDPLYINDGRSTYAFTKVLSDTAIALDYMTIADGSTFDYINVLPPDFVSDVSDNGNVFNFNKAAADLQATSDTLLPFTTILSKRDTVIQSQGPAYYDKAGYAPDFFADNYTEFFGPKYTFIKVLPTDYAVALDYMTIADGSTFNYTNVLPPDFVTDTSDKTTKQPTKALADNSPSQGDGNLHGQSYYAADYFEGYSALVGSTDTGFTADSGYSVDTYLHSPPETVTQYTVEYRPTIIFDKVRSDIMSDQIQGPAYQDGNTYCIGYFPIGQEYIGYQGPTFILNKILASFTEGTIMAGNIYKNSYVAGAFFATDFVGNAYTIS